MLEEIRISNVATYGDTPQRLEGLRQINLLFGTNGSGKTMISRVIANPAAHPSCAVIWRGDRSLETLVYNRDFVEHNFSQQLRGIFTLGEDAADTLGKFEEARAKVEEIEEQIGKLKTTLGNPGGTTGKHAELRRLSNLKGSGPWMLAVQGRVAAGETVEQPNSRKNVAARNFTGALVPSGSRRRRNAGAVRAHGRSHCRQEPPATG